MRMPPGNTHQRSGGVIMYHVYSVLMDILGHININILAVHALSMATLSFLSVVCCLFCVFVLFFTIGTRGAFYGCDARACVLALLRWGFWSFFLR